MRRKALVGILGVEAAVCVALRILQASLTGVFTAAMAFPFEQIGMGLRSLSLSGGLGNAAAIAVYCMVSLLPVAAMLVLWKKRKLRKEDGLLGVLSAVLFAVLYLMINPGFLHSLIGGMAGQSVGKAILGGVVYAVLCGYLILRALRLFIAGGTDQLVRYLSVMLSLLQALFVYMIFGACFGGLLDSVSSLRAGNVGNEHLLGVSYAFLVIRFAVDALPYALDIFIIFAALRLLHEMRTDRYSAESVAATERMSRFCAAALVATVLANIGFNLLQLLFAKSLMILDGSVQIPVFSVTFVLAALLLARLVAENKQLKDDNDRFI